MEKGIDLDLDLTTQGSNLVRASLHFQNSHWLQ